MKPRLNIYLDDHVAAQLALVAKKPGSNKSAIVNEALARFFNPPEDRRLDALIRRLDRMVKAEARLERNGEIALETLALFIRYFLTVTPPLPQEDQAAAHALGKARFETFIAQVGRRVAQEQNLVADVFATLTASSPDLFAADSFDLDRQAARRTAREYAANSGETVDRPEIDPGADGDDTQNLPPLRPVIVRDEDVDDDDWGSEALAFDDLDIDSDAGNIGAAHIDDSVDEDDAGDTSDTAAMTATIDEEDLRHA